MFICRLWRFVATKARAPLTDVNKSFLFVTLCTPLYTVYSYIHVLQMELLFLGATLLLKDCTMYVKGKNEYIWVMLVHILLLFFHGKNPCKKTLWHPLNTPGRCYSLILYLSHIKLNCPSSVHWVWLWNEKPTVRWEKNQFVQITMGLIIFYGIC